MRPSLLSVRGWPAERIAALWLVMVCLVAPAVVRAGPGDDAYAIAAGLYDRQQWKLAVDELQRFLSQFPDHPRAPDAVFCLAEALLQTNRLAEAEQHFRLYLSRQPDGQFARQALFRAGEAAYLLGRSDRAWDDLREFHRRWPDDALLAHALAYLGNLALGRNDTAAAEKYFGEALQRFAEGPLQDECRLGMAEVLEKKDQPDEAERYYLAVAGKPASPLAPEAQFRLGALQYSRGRFEQAADTLAAFEDRFAQSPRRARAALGRAWALWKLERLDESQAILASLTTDPAVGIEARYWLGLTQKTQEEWAAAAETLLGAAAVDPRHTLVPAIRFHAGDALLRAGRADAAARQFDLAALFANGKHDWLDDALLGKVRAALQLGDPSAAQKEADTLARRCAQSPLVAEAQRLLARDLIERKQFAPAAKLLEPLLAGADARDQRPETRYLLAVAYKGQSRWREALEVLEPVFASESADAELKREAGLQKGSLLVALKQYQAAIKPLEEYLRAREAEDNSGRGADDGLVEAQGQLAVCYARCGQLDEARHHYRQLLRTAGLHRLLPAVTEQLAEAVYAAEDADWAGKLFDWLVEQNVDPSAELKQRALAGAGWSRWKAGRLEDAQATFDRLLGQQPPAELAAEAALARGRILEQLDRLDAALAMFDLVVDQYAQSPRFGDALLCGARLRDRLQQDREAAEWYQRWATAYPKHPQRDAVLYQCAWALRDSGQEDEALRLFQRLKTDYPQSRYAADARYRLAEAEYAARKYEQAEQLLQEVFAHPADAPVREHAVYLQGQIAAARQDWQAAGAVFRRFIEQFPESTRRMVAEFWVAEAAYRNKDYADAEARFKRLATQIQGRTESWLAMIPLRLAQLLAARKEWLNAYDIAAKIEAQYPDFEQQYEVDYLVGRCLATRADFEGARAAFRRVIDSPQGRRTETEAMARWMIGETYFHQKNYEAAIREYIALEVLCAYPAWQAAALLQAGKCRELLGEHQEATELYARLLKQYPDQQPFADEARQRLEAHGLGGGDTPTTPDGASAADRAEHG